MGRWARPMAGGEADGVDGGMAAELITRDFLGGSTVFDDANRDTATRHDAVVRTHACPCVLLIPSPRTHLFLCSIGTSQFVFGSITFFVLDLVCVLRM